MDDIFEAEDIASDSECDSDCDSDDTTVAPSPCDSESDCSASTTDVDDSSDDAEYIPTPRKTSPGSSRTPKGSRMRGDVSDRSLSPESPSETEVCTSILRRISLANSFDRFLTRQRLLEMFAANRRVPTDASRPHPRRRGRGREKKRSFHASSRAVHAAS